MALKEEYHVVADMYPVSATSNPEIVEGMFVRLNSSGQAILATGASNTRSLGVAGDSTIDAPVGSKNREYQDALIVSPTGLKVNTSNRLSDPAGNDTAASGKITVYNGGGKFHTDIYETLNVSTPITYTPGDALYVSANGKLTNVSSANTQVVAVLTVAPREYPSGVPGTDTADGSISLGSFLTFVLLV
jgi:hypothetical protein